MTLEDFFLRLEHVAAAVGGLIVFGLAIQSYLRRRRRSVLLIAISGALGATLAFLNWVSETSSPTFWNFTSLCYVLDMTLWVIGCGLLLRELQKHDDEDAA